MGLIEEIYGPLPVIEEETPANVYEYENTPQNKSWAGALPVKQGLYDPDLEKDACGVGFACHIKGKASHKIVSDARNLLCNMTHRGAAGSDARDGDGAGVMTSIPHKFFIKNFEKETGIKLPPLGQYAAGNLFFKPDEETLKGSLDTFEDIAKSLGLRILGWREVPRDSSVLGPAALSREPLILQPFVVLQSAYGSGNSPESIDAEKFDERQFERQLYVLRKRATHTIGLQLVLSMLVEQQEYCLQGSACPCAGLPILSRSAVSGLRRSLCPRPLAILHQHIPQLGSCAATTMGCSQW